MDKIAYLSQFNLLQCLSLEDLREMDRMTSITTIPKNKYIQTPSSFTEGLYFIKKGKVRIYKLNTDGKQFTLDILNEGNVFGELSGISFGTREMFIETLEECDICLMDKSRFETFLIDHPRFMMNLLQMMSERIVNMNHLAYSLALGKLRIRILHVLIKLADQFGTGSSEGFVQIDLSVSHQEIANMVGATREAVSSILQDFVKEELIQTKYKTISIHKEKLIRELNRD
ncbi:MAG: Crp/Fnr family transcriptional regulator [Bacillota bacterium]